MATTSVDAIPLFDLENSYLNFTTEINDTLTPFKGEVTLTQVGSEEPVGDVGAIGIYNKADDALITTVEHIEAGYPFEFTYPTIGTLEVYFKSEVEPEDVGARETTLTVIDPNVFDMDHSSFTAAEHLMNNEPLIFGVGLESPSEVKLLHADLSLVIIIDGVEDETIQLIVDGEGVYRAEIQNPKPGSYRYKLKTPTTEADPLATTEVTNIDDFFNNETSTLSVDSNVVVQGTTFTVTADLISLRSEGGLVKGLKGLELYDTLTDSTITTDYTENESGQYLFPVTIGLDDLTTKYNYGVRSTLTDDKTDTGVEITVKSKDELDTTKTKVGAVDNELIIESTVMITVEAFNAVGEPTTEADISLVTSLDGEPTTTQPEFIDIADGVYQFSYLTDVVGTIKIELVTPKTTMKDTASFVVLDNPNMFTPSLSSVKVIGKNQYFTGDEINIEAELKREDGKVVNKAVLDVFNFITAEGKKPFVPEQAQHILNDKYMIITKAIEGDYIGVEVGTSYDSVTGNSKFEVHDYAIDFETSMIALTSGFIYYVGDTANLLATVRDIHRNPFTGGITLIGYDINSNEVELNVASLVNNEDGTYNASVILDSTALTSIGFIAEDKPSTKNALLMIKEIPVIDLVNSTISSDLDIVTVGQPVTITVSLKNSENGAAWTDPATVTIINKVTGNPLDGVEAEGHEDGEYRFIYTPLEVAIYEITAEADDQLIEDSILIEVETKVDYEQLCLEHMANVQKDYEDEEKSLSEKKEVEEGGIVYSDLSVATETDVGVFHRLVNVTSNGLAFIALLGETNPNDGGATEGMVNPIPLEIAVMPQYDCAIATGADDYNEVAVMNHIPEGDSIPSALIEAIQPFFKKKEEEDGDGEEGDKDPCMCNPNDVPIETIQDRKVTFNCVAGGDLVGYRARLQARLAAKANSKTN